MPSGLCSCSHRFMRRAARLLLLAPSVALVPSWWRNSEVRKDLESKSELDRNRSFSHKNEEEIRVKQYT